MLYHNDLPISVLDLNRMWRLAAPASPTIVGGRMADSEPAPYTITGRYRNGDDDSGVLFRLYDLAAAFGVLKWCVNQGMYGGLEICAEGGAIFAAPVEITDSIRFIDPPFHYSSYWGSWSRRLGSTPLHPFVEVNLTPIGGQERVQNAWEKEVQHIRIRAHATMPDPKDRDVLTLPPKIRALMESHLSAEVTERLLTEDFLPQIDWQRYARNGYGGGGVYLCDCCFPSIGDL